MLAYSALLLHLMGFDLGYYERYPYLILFILPIAFLIGPLHFLYASYLTHRSSGFGRKHLIHFVPFALYQLYLLTFLFDTENAVRAAFYPNTGLVMRDHIFNWSIIVQGMLYMLLTLLMLKRYSVEIKEVYSGIDKIRLTWLRNISFLILAIVVVFTVENAFMLRGINLSNFFGFSSVLFAASVYTMGYIGLSQSEILAAANVKVPANGNEASGEERTKKYRKSGLTPEKAGELRNRLVTLMAEDKPYTKNDLTFYELADRLSVSLHNLSEVINGHLNQNFFDFVNSYRVEKVKQDLEDPDKLHFTLLALAMDAGFNSKSSFNSIFKKHTGLAPSVYREQVLKKNTAVSR